MNHKQITIDNMFEKKTFWAQYVFRTFKKQAPGLHGIFKLLNKIYMCPVKESVLIAINLQK